MQRRTEELHHAVQEYLDVDWTSMKYYLRRQISKCVKECKSQASNAKRIVGTIRQHKNKEKASAAPVENGNGDQFYDSDDDFDYWDSDFDEDFDDEYCPENADLTVNLTVNESTAIKEDAKLDSSIPKNNSDIDTRSRFIPKPPDMLIVTPQHNFNSTQKSQQRNPIPRPPLKRPPSQPPPPPIAQVTSLEETPLEDYEIPISHQSSLSASPLSHTKDCDSTLSGSSSHSEIASPETYEVIEHMEENYEIIESPPIPVKNSEKPVLPPRMLASSTRPCQPPPLPQKPKKFQDGLALEKTDVFRSLDRPKLPLKQEDGSSSDGSPLVASAIGASFLNSLMGRRNSSPSPSLHAKEINGGYGGSSNRALNKSFTSNHSSRSSSPVKDDLFVVGSSSFVTMASSGFHGESPKSVHSEPSEIAQIMATRPLPPVPQVQNSQCPIDEADVTTFPWFHEVERSDAEILIQNLGQDGGFIVRPSKRAGKENPFSLTVLQDGRIFHLNIRLRSDGLFALGKEKVKEKSFPSVAALIGYHQNEHILLTSRGSSAGQTVLRVSPEKNPASNKTAETSDEQQENVTRSS